MKVLRQIILIIFFLTNINYLHCEDIEGKAKQHYRVGKILYEHGFYKAAEGEFKNAFELLKDVKRPSMAMFEEDQLSIANLPRAKRVPHYIIREADVLGISVWENPDLTREVIVQPDGRISFPLIGELEAAGLTIPQLDKVMTNRLKEYVRFPDVSISLVKSTGNKVIILGQVNDPGVYAIAGRKTLLEAIALAGGFTRDSVASSVMLIRGPLDNPDAKRINLTKAIDQPSSKENIALENEDIIFVPRKFITNITYFLNEVLEPIRRGYYYKEDVNTWEWRH